VQEIVSVRENVISFLLQQCDARDRQIAGLQAQLAAKAETPNVKPNGGAEAAPTQPAS